MENGRIFSAMGLSHHTGLPLSPAWPQSRIIENSGHGNIFIIAILYDSCLSIGLHKFCGIFYNPTGD